MIGTAHTDTLGGYTLTAAGFPDFYNRLMRLRFPISVADVLELRDLLNHSADLYQETPDAPQNREFRESLENAIHSFGIEHHHHSERLLRVLSMLRGMHYQHTIASRDAEARLRLQQANNRTRRRTCLRNGVISILTTCGLVLAWTIAAEVDLVLKLATLAPAFLALGYIHALPKLDSEMERLTRDLNEVLRQRIESLNWRTLIHKLSLLLGFKQIQGIEVFQQNTTEPGRITPLLH